ncbi:Imm51 family immunity protein [Gordonia sp. L191]|uniref:Imm51 family immunity protein n=1 Tax=Gordonia sp. L191 TaxID=2982699 RepID=UPI0024BF8B01|nr:Imm51 family immunity protein [Gordonia sp. L191]WHU47722.1 Imm51 family immunity protein [Gordonia sp. L191]
MAVNFHDIGGRFSLTFETGVNGEADEAVFASGHEPNGYFWEGFAQFAWPELSGRVSLDSEAGAFVAYGDDKEALRSFQAIWEATVVDPQKISEIIARAEAEGFEFDD